MNKIYFKQTDSYNKGEVYNSIKEVFFFYKMEEKLKPGATVLIKPNMLSGTKPEKAVTTHPVVVDTVIDVVKEYGVKPQDITLADSSGGPANPRIMLANYKACGFYDIAEKQEVNLYTKLDAKTIKVEGEIVKEFEILAPAADCDVIINLPKFKTHVMTGMSRAVKNMFGVIPGLKKAEMHMRFPQKENFAKMLVDLSLRVKPTLTIVDGITAMEGDGPSGGNARNLGMLVAGENSHYIDLAIGEMMGFAPDSLPLLKEAINRKLVPEKSDKRLICGDKQLYNIIDNWALPNSYRIDFGDRVPRPIRWRTPAVEKFLAPKPKIVKSRCIGCGRCADICPQHTITIKNKKAVINMNNCIKCFCCHEMCPVKAIDVKRSVFFNI